MFVFWANNHYPSPLPSLNICSAGIPTTTRETIGEAAAVAGGSGHGGGGLGGRGSIGGGGGVANRPARN